MWDDGQRSDSRDLLFRDLGQGELPFSLTIPPFAIQAIPGGMDLSPLCSFVLVRGGPWCTVLLRW